VLQTILALFLSMGLLWGYGMIPDARAAAPFGVTRVEIYFDNQRPEITTERNSPTLRAYARIRVKGSGLLQGYWKVDNQIVGQISQHVSGDPIVVLPAPTIPPLPTFNPGSHTLQFEIINPPVAFPLPKALYYVTPSDFKGAVAKIKPLTPAKNSSNSYDALTFTWEPVNNAVIYLVEFYNRAGGSSPIFSAMTRKPAYTLSERRLPKTFDRGKTYFWKVKGLDNRKNVVSESPVWDFSFEKD
jgi:hypothetical protein